MTVSRLCVDTALSSINSPFCGRSQRDCLVVNEWSIDPSACNSTPVSLHHSGRSCFQLKYSAAKTQQAWFWEVEFTSKDKGTTLLTVKYFRNFGRFQGSIFHANPKLLWRCNEVVSCDLLVTFCTTTPLVLGITLLVRQLLCKFKLDTNEIRQHQIRQNCVSYWIYNTAECPEHKSFMRNKFRIVHQHHQSNFFHWLFRWFSPLSSVHGRNR